MSVDMDLAEDTLPTPMVTSGMNVAAGALMASFFVSISSSQTMNGAGRTHERYCSNLLNGGIHPRSTSEVPDDAAHILIAVLALGDAA